MTNLSNIISELNTLNVEELRTLNNAVIETITAMRKIQSIGIKSQIKVGDIVTIDHKDCIGKNYKLTKINRTKAVAREIIFHDGEEKFDIRQIVVPISLIQINS
jgi:hypothetical protein